jgi:hypothetical protein
MIWNIFTRQDQYKEGSYYPVIKTITGLLILLLVWINSSSADATPSVKKVPHYSQFTDPPPIPNTLKSHCTTTLSTLKEAINCFKNKQLKQAKTLFTRIKSQAIKTNNRPLLLESHVYLALISIEQGRRKAAIKKIKHLFFLQAGFSLRQFGIDNKKYLTFFKKIKQIGRNINEKEVDDISSTPFIRVKSCTNRDCKDGIWQKISGHNNINHEISCSLQGNCVDDIKCSLEGTCNKK